MRTRLFFALAFLFLLVPSARPSLAALLGLQVVVAQNSGSGFVTVGTAIGRPTGSTPYQVNSCCVGNTIRFTVQFDQVATYQAYGTTLMADDPTEIDFIPGSAMDLSGKGFAGFFGNPNNSLNDATPESGLGNSAGSGFVTGQNLYVLDYTVTSSSFDSLTDFTVTLTALGSGNTINALKRAVPIQIFTSFEPTPVPEPFSLGLLLSALAGLGFLRRCP